MILLKNQVSKKNNLSMLAVDHEFGKAQKSGNMLNESGLLLGGAGAISSKSLNKSLSKHELEKMEDVKSYNDKLKTLDPMYSNLETSGIILVRVFCHAPFEMNESGNFWVPRSTQVAGKLKSGMPGVRDYLQSPFPYVKKGVVVTAPKGFNYDKGDVVILENVKVVEPAPELPLVVVGGFVHPDSGLTDSPTDIKSDHFGYIIVRPTEILFKEPSL